MLRTAGITVEPRSNDSLCVAPKAKLTPSSVPVGLLDALRTVAPAEELAKALRSVAVGDALERFCRGRTAWLVDDPITRAVLDLIEARLTRRTAKL